MLCGRALQFHFDNFQGICHDMEDLCEGLQKRLLSKDHVRSLLREWDPMTLSYFISQHVDKQPTECFERLVSSLQDIQSGLSKKYSNESIFQNKLLNAIRDFDACKFAYF